MKILEEIIASHFNIVWLIISGFAWIITIGTGISLLSTIKKDKVSG